MCNKTFFRAEGALRNYGTSINISSKTQEKEVLQGNILEFFFLDTLKTTYQIENLTQKWTQSSFFFENPGTFFLEKRAEEVFPCPPSCAPVSVAKYASISLNMPQYP